MNKSDRVLRTSTSFRSHHYQPSNACRADFASGQRTGPSEVAKEPCSNDLQETGVSEPAQNLPAEPRCLPRGSSPWSTSPVGFAVLASNIQPLHAACDDGIYDNNPVRGVVREEARTSLLLIRARCIPLVNADPSLPCKWGGNQVQASRWPVVVTSAPVTNSAVTFRLSCNKRGLLHITVAVGDISIRRGVTAHAVESTVVIWTRIAEQVRPIPSFQASSEMISGGECFARSPRTSNSIVTTS